MSAAAPLVRTSWQRVVIIGLVTVIVLVTGGIWWWQAHRRGLTLSAAFSETVGVYPGSDVRILGVRVGKVDSVRPAGTQVIVGMHLDPGIAVQPDTWAVIVSPNLVSDRYVQLTGVYTSGPKLVSGSRIPLARTRTPVELDQLYRNLQQLTTALGPEGANRDGALNRLLVTAAANLGGNGTELNKTLTNLSAATSTLGNSRTDIVDTISQLSQFTAMLQQNNDGVVTLNQQLAAVSQTLANDRQSFAQAMQELSSALGLVKTFVQDNRAKLSTSVAKLNAVAQVLAAEQGSLTKALKSAPQLVQNFINAYDPTNNVLRGRVDLNEISVWNTSSATTSSGPPTLLPGSGG